MSSMKCISCGKSFFSPMGSNKCNTCTKKEAGGMDNMGHEGHEGHDSCGCGHSH